MRMSVMDHKASSSRARAGSTASTHKYNDYQSDYTHQSSDQESRISKTSSRGNADNTSDMASINKVSKPINAAVTSALGQAAETTHTTLPPEVLNQITTQITASVLQQLKEANIQAIPTDSTAVPSEQVESSSVSDASPLDRKVYTPDSTTRVAETTGQSQTSPTFSNFSAFSTNSRQPTSPKDRRPLSPFSSGSGHDDSDEKEKLVRPEPPQRISTSGDTTVLEKAWGKMFDKEGQFTTRLSQFLRGIAVHIIEDYEPKHSLVITPQKMQKYYEETRLPNECYPWHEIFDDETSFISRMFRELEIQHHLIQKRPHERPDIPGMTPEGFEAWMKLVLKSRPDLEFERLAKTALHMPISNPDERTERFPKELSRRLFPTEADPIIAARLEKVMRQHCRVRLGSRNNSVVDPGPKSPVSAHRRSGKSPPAAGTSIHRSQTIDPSMLQHSQLSRSTTLDRPPQSIAVSESAVHDDVDEGTFVKPIERERKPYIAQPGMGKSYEGGESINIGKTLSNIETHSLPPLTLGQSGRSPSFTSQGRNGSRSRTIPVAIHQQDFPDSRHRSQNYYPSETRDDRNRSPSVTRSREYGHRSDNDIKPSSYQSGGPSDYYPSSYQSGGSSDYQPPPYRSERHQRDRRSSFNNESREKGREPRTRFQSTGGADGARYSNNNAAEEEFYRSAMPGYSGSEGGGYAQYPPSAFKPKG